MGRYTGATERLSRREGVELELKGARRLAGKGGLERRGGTPPGQHGRARSRRPSVYGRQLPEDRRAIVVDVELWNASWEDRIAELRVLAAVGVRTAQPVVSVRRRLVPAGRCKPGNRVRLAAACHAAAIRVVANRDLRGGRDDASWIVLPGIHVPPIVRNPDCSAPPPSPWAPARAGRRQAPSGPTRRPRRSAPRASDRR